LSVPQSIRTYYDANWHNIKEQWVLGLKFVSGNFLNRTNNRLKNFNGKLKIVIDPHSSLENFLDKFYVVLTCMRNERSHKAAILMQKVKLTSYPTNPVEAEFRKALTSYAADNVVKQLHLKDSIRAPIVADGDNFSMASVEEILRVNKYVCSCMFHRAMHLPCRHIFSVREHIGLPLYDEQLYSHTWSLGYFKEHELVSIDNSINPSVQITSHQGTQKVLSQHEKYRLAMTELSHLATLISESSGESFKQRMQVIRDIKCGWELRWSTSSFC